MIEGPSFQLLGVRIDPLSHEAVIRKISEFCRSGSSTGLSVTAATLNNLAVARKDESYRAVMNSLDLVLPDGAPILWSARAHGTPLPSRTYGPELMALTIDRGPDFLRHFILGGSPEALSKCVARFEGARPGAVAGSYSPPFGSWPPDEPGRIAGRVRDSGANVVWVCLGNPKQERWIAENRMHYPGVALVAVGAAVDFLSGTKKQAPAWMQRAGLEWLFRLMTEPRRLWRRYVIDMPPAAFALVVEHIRNRRSRRPNGAPPPGVSAS